MKHGLLAFFALAALAFAQDRPLDNIASRQYQHEVRPLRLFTTPTFPCPLHIWRFLLRAPLGSLCVGLSPANSNTVHLSTVMRLV